MELQRKQQTIEELRDIIATDLEKIGLAMSTIRHFKQCVDRFRKFIAKKGAPDYYDEHLAAEYLKSMYDYPACVAEKRVTSWVYTNSTAINRLASMDFMAQ